MASFEFIEHMGGMDIKMFGVTIQKRQTHYHGDIEILTPIEGSVNIDLAYKRTLVNTGDFFVINRNEAHSLSSINGANTLLVLQFNPGFCKDYYPMLSQMTISRHHIERARMPELHDSLRRCFSEMIHAVGEKQDGYQLLLVSALNRLAYSIVRYAEFGSAAGRIAAGDDRMRLRMANIMDYIQKNFSSSISLAELSRAEGLDMAYLSHYIKKNLGVSFREYVNRLRFERAMDLVLNTDMRFIDVCIECGYSDYRYLNKAFQKEFGLTPAQLRQSGGRGGYAAMVESADADAEHSFMNISVIYESICDKLDSTKEDPA